MACTCGTEEPAIHIAATKFINISRKTSLSRILLNEECLMHEMEVTGPRSFPHTLIQSPGHIQDLKTQYPEAGRCKGSKAVHGCDLYDSVTTPITKASDPPFKHSIVYNRRTAAQTDVQVPEYIYKSRNGSRRTGECANKTSKEEFIQGLNELPEVDRRGALKVLLRGSRAPSKAGANIWKDVLSAAKRMSSIHSKCALVGREAAMCPSIGRDEEGHLYSYDPTDPLASFYIYDRDIRHRRNSHMTLPQFTEMSPGTPMTTAILPLIREQVLPEQRTTQMTILNDLRTAEIALRTQARDAPHIGPDMQKRKTIESLAILRCMATTWGNTHTAPSDDNTRHKHQDDCFIGSDATVETLIMANQSLGAMEADIEEWTAYQPPAEAETDMGNMLNLHWGPTKNAPQIT